MPRASARAATSSAQSFRRNRRIGRRPDPAAVTTVVEGHDVELPRQRLERVHPVQRRRRGPAVQQHERRQAGSSRPSRSHPGRPAPGQRDGPPGRDRRAAAQTCGTHRREHVRPVLGDQDRVLELRGARQVGGDRRPVVVPHAVMPVAHRDHRLDGEHPALLHPGRHPGVEVVGHLRRHVEAVADPVTDERAHDTRSRAPRRGSGWRGRSRSSGRRARRRRWRARGTRA